MQTPNFQSYMYRLRLSKAIGNKQAMTPEMESTRATRNTSDGKHPKRPEDESMTKYDLVLQKCNTHNTSNKLFHTELFHPTMRPIR